VHILGLSSCSLRRNVWKAQPRSTSINAAAIFKLRRLNDLPVHPERKLAEPFRRGNASKQEARRLARIHLTSEGSSQPANWGRQDDERNRSTAGQLDHQPMARRLHCSVSRITGANGERSCWSERFYASCGNPRSS